MADELRGATITPPPELTPTAEGFDLVHAANNPDSISWRLAAEAYGDDYPAEVQAFGMTTYWLLGRYVSELRIGPGDRLADLACGRGGPGLWVARATGADLIGIDWSVKAIEAARVRAEDFVSPGRARFEVGDLAATGLADASVDAAMCADAIFFALDRVAAFTEVARILRPGGAFVFTCDEDGRAERAMAVPDWTPLVEAGGLVVERKEIVPRFAEQLQRMYDLWLEHLDEIRAELGAEVAAEYEQEATVVGPTLAGRTPLIVTARRP